MDTSKVFDSLVSLNIFFAENKDGNYNISPKFIKEVNSHIENQKVTISQGIMLAIMDRTAKPMKEPEIINLTAMVNRFIDMQKSK